MVAQLETIPLFSQSRDLTAPKEGGADVLRTVPLHTFGKEKMAKHTHRTHTPTPVLLERVQAWIPGGDYPGFKAGR